MRADPESRRCCLIRSLVLLLFLLIPSQASAAGYLVRPGDTLSAIAGARHVSIGALARANGIANPNLVRSGRYLTIPGAARPQYYHVRWGDTLLGIAVRFHV